MKQQGKIKVLAKANGPIIISGHFIFENEEGDTKEMKRVVLCRCSESGTMPFCDASHNRIGFCSKS